MVRARVILPNLNHLPPVEADIQELLRRFDRAVKLGKPQSFATFISLWNEMHFSFVFETRPLETSQEQYVQSMFASALDCLEVPLQPPQRFLMEAETANARTPSDPPATEADPGLNHEPGLIAGSAVSLADLVDGEEGEEEDPEQLQQIARALQSNSNLALEHGPERESGVEAADCSPGVQEVDLTALELLSSELAGLEAEHQRLDHEVVRQDALGSEQEGPAMNLTSTYSQQDLTEQPPDPEVVRIGCIYMLHCLFHAQPSKNVVRIYVPLHLFQGLIWMVGKSKETDQILKRLLAEKAFLLGALRRPISCSREARLAGRQVKFVLDPDKSQQRHLVRHGLAKLKVSGTKLGAMRHIQLLCNSYKQSQERLWGGQQNLPQGLFDLKMGESLGGMVDRMEQSIERILLPYSPDNNEPNANKAQHGSQKKGSKRRMLPETAHRREERQKASTEAAARRQLRYAAQDQQDDADVPSLEMLGLSTSGQQNADDDMPDISSLQMPRSAQIVVQRKLQEDREVRMRMGGWKQAFESKMRGTLVESSPHGLADDVASAGGTSKQQKPGSKNAQRPSVPASSQTEGKGQKGLPNHTVKQSLGVKKRGKQSTDSPAASRVDDLPADRRKSRLGWQMQEQLRPGPEGKSPELPASDARGAEDAAMERSDEVSQGGQSKGRKALRSNGIAKGNGKTEKPNQGAVANYLDCLAELDSLLADDD